MYLCVVLMSFLLYKDEILSHKNTYNKKTTAHYRQKDDYT